MAKKKNKPPVDEAPVVEEVTITVSAEDAEVLGIEAGEHQAKKTKNDEGQDVYAILDADGEVVGTVLADDEAPELEDEDEGEPLPEIPVKESKAIKPADKKADEKKLLKVGDHLPHEVIHYMTVKGCSVSEAIKHYNSKQV